MTISSTTTSQQFTCNGVADTYAVTFAFLTDDEIDVYHLANATGVITLLTKTTDYSVSGTPDSNGHYTSGATVTTVTTYPSGDRITVERNSNRTQTADYSVAGAFPAEQHEGALDKLTFLAQEIWSKLSTTISVAYGSTFSGTTALNVDEASGGDVIRLNAGKTAFELTDPVNAALTTTLTPTDGNFIVGDGTDFVTESGATARTSLGLGDLAVKDDVNNDDWSGTDLAIANGGTGASTAAAARTNLGLVIGTDVQAQNANLQDIADLTPSANDMVYFTGAGASATQISSFGRSLVDDANASAARTTLGLAIGTDVQAQDAGLQSISGLTTAADKMIYTTASDTYATTDLTSFARTLLDDADAATARATLGVGTGTGDVTAASATTQYKVPYWDSVSKQLVDGVAPGTSGNVLTSDGTEWKSVAPRYANNYMGGPSPVYTSAASITLPTGLTAMNSTNAHLIEVGSDQAISLASVGANGLDTGSEAGDTWYYVYLIGDSTGVNTPKGLFSVTNEANTGTITLPSGYDIKRQLPLAVRNDGSSNIIPFYIEGVFGLGAKVMYDVHQDAVGNSPTNELYVTTSATTYTNIDCTGTIPPISELGIFDIRCFFTGSGEFNFRQDGSSGDGLGLQTQSSGNFTNGFWPIRTASQIIEYKSPHSGADVCVNTAGYVVTEL